MKSQNYHELALKSGFRVTLRGRSIWKAETSINSLKSKNEICPKCKTKLLDFQTQIPVSQTREATVLGFRCPSCHKFYVCDSEKTATIMYDNAFAKGFTLDGKELWNATDRKNQERKRRQRLQDKKHFSTMLKSIESSVVWIHISYGNQKEEHYIIINDAQKAVPKDRILHYSSETARELLTAAFHESREGEGVLEGKQFYVVQYLFANDSNQYLPSDIAPVELYIGRGGGLYSCLINNGQEIVEMLLYSPFNGRYEIIKATYEKEEYFGHSFVDIRLYRKFVEEYGNPQVDIFPRRTYGGKNGWDKLNAESILKIYGYNVSEKQDLSTTERHELLAEIIDLSILPVIKIISHLEFTIGTHASSKYELARDKWKDDMEFVTTYRANPSRFLIAKDKVKRKRV